MADQDLQEAARWYRKSAEQGFAAAQENLGEMYRYGHGVVQDLVMAYVWFDIAARNNSYNLEGRKDPEEEHDEALARLNASELRLGRKLSKLCLKKPAKCPEYSDD